MALDEVDSNDKEVSPKPPSCEGFCLLHLTPNPGSLSVFSVTASVRPHGTQGASLHTLVLGPGAGGLDLRWQLEVKPLQASDGQKSADGTLVNTPECHLPSPSQPSARASGAGTGAAGRALEVGG